MKRPLAPGDRVTTPLGLGTVAYLRMDHLGDITKVAAVSVVLDVNLHLRPGYSGTIFAAKDVKHVPPS